MIYKYKIIFWVKKKTYIDSNIEKCIIPINFLFNTFSFIINIYFYFALSFVVIKNFAHFEQSMLSAEFLQAIILYPGILIQRATDVKW